MQSHDLAHITEKEHNILIVDKDISVISQIERSLIEKDHYILDSTTESGTAMDKINNSFYSVAIIGYSGLPNNGFELLKNIKQHSPDTFVIVTAHNYDEDLEAKLLGEGAYHIIEPSMGKVRLQAHVSNAISHAKSYKDGKTGFYTSDVFIERLSDSLNLMPSQDTLRGHSRKDEVSCISLLLIDFDYFKRINDTYGHITGGDLVLRGVSNDIRKYTRTNDLHGRYGGDELAVAMANLNYEDAIKRAETIRRSIEELKIPMADGRLIPSTVTIGVATLPYDGLENSPSSLIIAADKSLYHGKDIKGRNSVTGFLELPNGRLILPSPLN